MTIPLKPYPAAASKVLTGGHAIVAIYAGAAGGRLMNPFSAADQGISVVETLFYSYVGPAGLTESATTFPLPPGYSVYIPPGLATNISVNAATSGHRFSAFVLQPPPQPALQVAGVFPPSGPTSLVQTVKSYLYEQYSDDDDLQAWVRSQNEIMQDYCDWFNQVNLPIYTGPLVSGALLDWVAQGLYGMQRPTLSSGKNLNYGPYNTAPYDLIAYNESRAIGSSDVTATTDDIFKRILTWRLYRGDGKNFNMLWLKRRCMRFLYGENGTDPVIDSTYGISAVFASRTQINIILPNVPNATILKEAIDSGAVELPFQFTYNVTVTL